jgi:hypothetical protein
LPLRERSPKSRPRQPPPALAGKLAIDYLLGGGAKTAGGTDVPRLLLVSLLGLAALLAGCATGRVESDHLGPPGAIERAMMNHYERHASEDGARCVNPYIDGFTRLTVIEDTPEQLVVGARYFWRDRVQEGGDSFGMTCSGFGERTFVLEADARGRPVVVEMTGEQDEGVIRSLIRRALPE